MSVDGVIESVTSAQAEATRRQIGMALLAKSQEAVKMQGQAAVELLNAAARLGKAIDKGGQFDVVG